MGSLANDKGPARGIEPRTSGLEVLRAIQLRHAGSLLLKLWRKYLKKNQVQCLHF
jgi:hypothetical protein